MWWTVKHWRVKFDYYQWRDLSAAYNPGDYTLINQSVNVTTRTASNNFFSDYVRRIENEVYGLDTSERALVCATLGGDWEAATRMNAWNVELEREFFVNGNSGTTTINSALYLYTNWDQQQFGFGPPFCFSEDQTDRAKFWAALSFDFAGWISWEDRQGETSSGQFSLLGQERTFALSHNLLSSIISESISNLVIEPAEFWEYDPNDGLGPIYDKETGKQLRAFPGSSASALAPAS